MRIKFYKFSILVAFVLMIVGLLGCKGQESDSSSKVTVDISGVVSELNALAAANTGQNASAIGENKSVQTLAIAPLTYANHGGTYNPDTFSDADEDDFEDDAVNSADFIKFIDLPTSSETVELEVPTISNGWQLIAVATKESIASATDFPDATIYYYGFTRSGYKSAEEFAADNPTLIMQLYCDQDADKRPAGCN